MQAWQQLLRRQLQQQPVLAQLAQQELVLELQVQQQQEQELQLVVQFARQVLQQNQIRQLQQALRQLQQLNQLELQFFVVHRQLGMEFLYQPQLQIHQVRAWLLKMSFNLFS